MLWKLDALQAFIRDLHWPEEVFAEHLDHRLKLMAADMIEAAATRSAGSSSFRIGYRIYMKKHLNDTESRREIPVSTEVSFILCFCCVVTSGRSRCSSSG